MIVEDNRSDLVRSALAKGLALLAGVAVVIALGTYVVVHALGLNGGGGGGTVIGSNPAPPSPLPTSALPVPHSSAPTPDTGPAAPSSPSSSNSLSGPATSGTKGLRLSMSPLTVSPMQRINLTGTYGNHDGISLQIQRWENGSWSDFPTTAQVSLGTFATYIQSGTHGPQKFRVYDPGAHAGSNVVTITVR